jgi:hypothetical protein
MSSLLFVFWTVYKAMSREAEEKDNEKRWLILRVRLAEENIKSAFRLFRENGIEPVLIKGWAVAREYPEMYQRFFSDIDLSVAPDDYEKALQLVEGIEGGNLNIDLHCGLRHLDTLEWDRLFANSEVELIDEVPVRILRVEDHLRVLCVHWLTDGGAYKDRLLDIYYLLQNNADKFDWDACFHAIDENRREWIIKTIALVHKYHPLDVSKLPFAVGIDSIPKWFTKALEKEWASETRLQPLHVYLNSRKELWKQLKKRFPPNAIQSTVLMNGKFDESPRLFYQLGSIFQRLKPSIKKTLIFLKGARQKKIEKDV